MNLINIRNQEQKITTIILVILLTINQDIWSLFVLIMLPLHSSIYWQFNGDIWKMNQLSRDQSKFFMGFPNLSGLCCSEVNVFAEILSIWCVFQNFSNLFSLYLSIFFPNLALLCMFSSVISLNTSIIFDFIAFTSISESSILFLFYLCKYLLFILLLSCDLIPLSFL